MIKKYSKIILIITVIIASLFICMPKSFADVDEEGSASGGGGSYGRQISPLQITGQVDGDAELDTQFAEKIVEMLRIFGIFLAVGALMVIGIKYIAGSVEEKAEYKKTMMPYLIGCLLVFGAATMGPTILDLFKGMNSTENMANRILGVIQIVGSFVTVGVLMILGIKYMVGSADERASYKKSMLPYVIGCILLFGAVNLTSLIYNMGLSKFDITNVDNTVNSFASGKTKSELQKERESALQKRTEAYNKDPNGEEFKYWQKYVAQLDEWIKFASD